MGGAPRIIKKVIETPKKVIKNVAGGGSPDTSPVTERRVEVAKKTEAVVLLKGPTTVVADPEGQVMTIKAGDQRLATAGSGDVLSGIIGAFLARGATAFNAACAAAYLHGELVKELPLTGIVAGDLDEPLPRLLERLGVDSPKEKNE